MDKHYFNMVVNSIDRNAIKNIEGEKSQVLFKNKNSIPEGENIMIFQGVFSQNFKKGEASRNGYKYDQKGWVVDNYSRLPIMLWQHDSSYGGIGFCQELWLDTKENLVGLFYVDLDVLEERNAKQVRAGYVTSISTGAITLEDGYEHIKTGKIYSKQDVLDEFGFNAVWEAWMCTKDRVFTYIVTKAELLENSLVTIGSNFGAIAKKANSLEDVMKVKADELLQEHNISINNKEMTKEEMEALQNELKTSKDTLEAKMTEVNDLTSQINTLKGEKEELETKVNTLESEKNVLAEELTKANTTIKANEDKVKAEILANVNNGANDNTLTDVKDVNSFEKKYS